MSATPKPLLIAAIAGFGCLAAAAFSTNSVRVVLLAAWLVLNTTCLVWIGALRRRSGTSAAIAARSPMHSATTMLLAAIAFAIMLIAGDVANGAIRTGATIALVALLMHWLDSRPSKAQ